MRQMDVREGGGAGGGEEGRGLGRGRGVKRNGEKEIQDVRQREEVEEEVK